MIRLLLLCCILVTAQASVRIQSVNWNDKPSIVIESVHALESNEWNVSTTSFNIAWNANRPGCTTHVPPTTGPTYLCAWDCRHETNVRHWAACANRLGVARGYMNVPPEGWPSRSVWPPNATEDVEQVTAYLYSRTVSRAETTTVGDMSIQWWLLPSELFVWLRPLSATCNKRAGTFTTPPIWKSIRAIQSTTREIHASIQLPQSDILPDISRIRSIPVRGCCSLKSMEIDRSTNVLSIVWKNCCGDEPLTLAIPFVFDACALTAGRLYASFHATFVYPKANSRYVPPPIQWYVDPTFKFDRFNRVPLKGKWSTSAAELLDIQFETDRGITNASSLGLSLTNDGLVSDRRVLLRALDQHELLPSSRMDIRPIIRAWHQVEPVQSFRDIQGYKLASIPSTSSPKRFGADRHVLNATTFSSKYGIYYIACDGECSAEDCLCTRASCTCILHRTDKTAIIVASSVTGGFAVLLLLAAFIWCITGPYRRRKRILEYSQVRQHD